MLGFEILVGDCTLALKKRDRAGEMAQRVGVLAAKPDNWSVPKSLWWKKTGVRKLASDLCVDTPTQMHCGGLETRRGPEHSARRRKSRLKFGFFTDSTGLTVKHGDPRGCPQL